MGKLYFRLCVLESVWQSFSWGFSKEQQSKKLFRKSQPSQTKDVHILPSSTPTDFWIVEIWVSLAMSRRLKWACRNRTFYPHGPFLGGWQLRQITFIQHHNTWNQAKVHLQKKFLEKAQGQCGVQGALWKALTWRWVRKDWIWRCLQNIYMLNVGMSISL